MSSITVITAKHRAAFLEKGQDLHIIRGAHSPLEIGAVTSFKFDNAQSDFFTQLGRIFRREPCLKKTNKPSLYPRHHNVHAILRLHEAGGEDGVAGLKAIEYFYFIGCSRA